MEVSIVNVLMPCFNFYKVLRGLQNVVLFKTPRVIVHTAKQCVTQYNTMIIIN